MTYSEDDDGIMEADLDQGQPPMRIAAGSHSRLVVFEQCKAHAKIKWLDKIPEPRRPLPPGKTEHPNERGERVHRAAEAFIMGGVELIPELEKFRAELENLRGLYAEGRVSLEGEWAFTRDWESVAWMSSDVWCRIKCDCVVFVSDEEGLVIDYKTGKRYGNELKHGEQMQLYQLGCFTKYPKLEKVRVELWYTDLDELHGMDFTRDQGLRFAPNFERRLDLLTMCEDFPPNPNRYSCKWCPYKPVEYGGTGHCSVGVA